VNQTGPLVVRWIAFEHGPVEAGAAQMAIVEAQNDGSATWRTRARGHGLFLTYHWLDERRNPIVWDGERTELDRLVEPGEVLRQEMTLRGPIPPGRYRLAVDMLEERRFWLAELGNREHEELVDVVPRDASGARAFVPDSTEPEPGWHELVAALHAEGYAAVGGAILESRGLRRRRSAELVPYMPGGGRHPRFPHPLVCPSLLAPLEPNDEVAGLPAYRPEGREPWMFDGRAVIRLR
jgi:hypothetical protein